MITIMGQGRGEGEGDKHKNISAKEGASTETTKRRGTAISIFYSNTV